MGIRQHLILASLWLGACGGDLPAGFDDPCDASQACADGLVCLYGACAVACDEESDCRGLVSWPRWTDCAEQVTDSGLGVVTACEWATE